MAVHTLKMNGDRCLYCDHPRSAHDPYANSCIAGDGACDCQEFAEDESQEDEED